MEEVPGKGRYYAWKHPLAQTADQRQL